MIISLCFNFNYVRICLCYRVC